jgi:hypothetical protein
VVTFTGFFRINQIFADADYLYLNEQDHPVDVTMEVYLTVVNRHTGAIVSRTGTTALPSDRMNNSGLYIEGDYAYIVGTKLSVLDISNRASPSVLGTTAGTVPPGVRINKENGRIWCASGGGFPSTIVSVDVSTPASPVVNTPGGSYLGDSAVAQVFAGSTHAIYIDGGWLRSYDITDPSNPFQSNQAGSGGANHRYIIRNGNYAYVSRDGGNNNELLVFDISDPDSVFLDKTIGLTPLNGNGGGFDMLIINGQLYVGQENATVSIWDIATDPSTPSQIDTLSPLTYESAPTRLATTGHWLYASSSDNNDGVIDAFYV